MTCDGLHWVQGWPVLCTDDDPCPICARPDTCRECGPWCPTGCPDPDAIPIT